MGTPGYSVYAQFQHKQWSCCFFQVPVDADDDEIEERIIQHLTAAAAIRRSHRHARREGRRNRSAAHGHPQILVFSTAESTSGGSVSSTSRQEGDHEHAPAVISAHPLRNVNSTDETTADTSVHDTVLANNDPVVPNNRYFLQKRGLHYYNSHVCMFSIHMGLTLAT